MSSSPLSEGYSTTSVEDDTTTSSSSSPTSSTSGSVCKPNWYDRVIRGEHLEEMRSLHSYICGGKADWSKELNRSADANNFMVQVEPPLLGNKLGRTRVSLLGARSRGVAGELSFTYACYRVSCGNRVLGKFRQLWLRLRMASPNGTSGFRRLAKWTLIVSTA